MSHSHAVPKITLKEILATSDTFEELDLELGRPVQKTRAGEFGLQQRVGEARKDFLDRMFTQIKNFMLKVAKLAEKEIDPKNKNSVFLFATNELFFFSASPITLIEFETLMQRVMNLPAELPPESPLVKYAEFFEFAFGSFAVQASEEQSMNVTPHFKWGKEPTLTPLVKSHPAKDDPIHYHETADRGAVPLKYMSATKNPKINYAIKVNGKDVPFTYDNVIKCKTAGNLEYVTLLEICADNILKTARNALFKRFRDEFARDAKETTPFFCNHLLLSNPIKYKKENCVGTAITHCDPLVLPYKYVEHFEAVEEKEAAFGSRFRIQERRKRQIYHVLPEVLIEFIRSGDEQAANQFLTKHKQELLLHINDVSTLDESPLVAALATGKLQMAQRLVTEFSADCKLAFRQYMNNDQLTGQFFANAVQIPEFRNVIDVDWLVTNGRADDLCTALAAGAKFNNPNEMKFHLNDKNSGCFDLLVAFANIKNKADKKLLPLLAAKELDVQLKDFFVKKRQGWNFFSKKTSIKLSDNELQLCADIKAAPNNALEIVNAAIKKLLQVHLQQIQVDQLAKFAEPKFLKYLLRIQTALIAQTKKLALAESKSSQLSEADVRRRQL